MCFIVLLSGIAEANQKALDSQLKAAFIERFTRFITFPDKSEIEDPKKPFVLVVFGDPTFGATLEEVYQKQKILNKPVIIKYANKIEDISDAHLVYVASNVGNRISELLEYLADKPILTIADTKGFCESGVMINLFVHNKSLKFEVNEKSINSSPLKMSHLLFRKAARVVK